MEQIRREHPDLVLYNGYDKSSPLVFWRAQTAVSAALTTHGLALSGDREGAERRRYPDPQKLQTECNKVIDLLIKTGVSAA